jgi:hypothetical protein
MILWFVRIAPKILKCWLLEELLLYRQYSIYGGNKMTSLEWKIFFNQTMSAFRETVNRIYSDLEHVKINDILYYKYIRGQLGIIIEGMDDKKLATEYQDFVMEKRLEMFDERIHELLYKIVLNVEKME